MLTKQDLTAARKAYDDTIAEAERQRGATILRALAEDMPQKDITEAMGYTRETVRRITKAAKEAAEAQ
jgi:CRP-like cAMP-binding protein